MRRETMPDWLDALDDKLVTVKLHGDRIGRGTLYLFGSEFGNHMVDLWNVTLIIDTDRSSLSLEGIDTLCINAKTT